MIDSTFTIGKHSGIISLLHPLVFEHRKSHNLTVYAFDKNIHDFSTVYAHSKDFSNFSTTPVNINVIDENEYNPEFKQLIYNITIAENSYFYDTLKAVDKDTADRIQYRIIDPILKERFEIDINGVLRNIAVLDFESQKKFDFIVEASDNGINQRIGYTRVIINLQNINDNLPVILIPSYAVSVPELTSVGYAFVTFNAVDNYYTYNNCL